MIAGVATETIVESTRIMKKPRHRANSAGQGLTSGDGASDPFEAEGWAEGEVLVDMKTPNTRAPTIHPGVETAPGPPAGA